MKWSKPIFLFLIGGMIYCIIEMIWRGYSHLSMFLLGGICFIFIGSVNEYLSWETPIWKQQIVSMGIITILEFLMGLTLNLKLRMNVWDYSNMRFNLLGQICLEYSLLWFLLSLPAILLDDYLRYWFFGEEKPYYKLF